MKVSVTRVYPGNFKSLKPISEFIIEIAEHLGFSSSEVYAIQTAVDEACSNIIDHAYGGENIGNIKIRVVETKKSLRIMLFDQGKPFDPDDIPDPDIHSPLEVRRERGLGVFFMRKLMDKVDFDFSSTEGNKLTLVKYKGS